MITIAELPTPPRPTGTGRPRVPWAYWRTHECETTTVIRRHRTGRVARRPSRCRASGCPTCHAARRASSMAGLDGLTPAPGLRWYLATVTPPVAIRRLGDVPSDTCDRTTVRVQVTEADGRTRTRTRAACGRTGKPGPCDCARRARYGCGPDDDPRETRDWYLDQLRGLIGEAQRQGIWAGAYVVLEAATGGDRGRGDASEVGCPYRARWWASEPPDVQLRGQELEDACRAGVCEVCEGTGRIPGAHLHAHLLLLARPFWYGRGQVSSLDTAWKRALAGFDLEDGRGPAGFRDFAESRGFQVFDFQAVSDADAARAYAAKLVRGYISKVSKGQRADGALLAAWMQGRRSSWATGALYGLSGAEVRSLGWETIGLDPELPPEREDRPETPEPVELVRVRRYTQAYRAASNGSYPLVLPGGPNSPRPPRRLDVEAGRGDVLVLGDVYPTVFVGGSPCGQIARGADSAPRPTMLRVVHRALSRYLRGHCPEWESWDAWWNGSLVVCLPDTPPAPAEWRSLRTDSGALEVSPLERTLDSLARSGWEASDLVQLAARLLAMAYGDDSWASEPWGPAPTNDPRSTPDALA